MSTTVEKQPFLIGWAKNRLAYSLLCNGIDSEGSPASFTFTFANTNVDYGAYVVLTLDGREIAFKRASSPAGNYEFSTRTSLATKIGDCPYVSALFETTYTVGSRTLTFTALADGQHTLTIHTLSTAGMPDGFEKTLITSSIESGGTDRKRKDNYAVSAQVEVTVNDGNHLKVYQGDNMVMTPDSDGRVRIPLDLLRGYIPQPDLPSTTDGQMQLLTNAMMKYRLRYSEMYGSPAPLLQQVITTGYKYALCGEMTERYAEHNLPDWNGGQRQRFIVSSNDTFWVIGEDTGKTLATRLSAPVFLYGLWYDSTKIFGATLNVAVEVTGRYEDGSGINISRNFSVKNGYPYRMKASPADFSIGDTVVWDSVQITTDGGQWERTYRVLPDLYESHLLLLQNKYGMLMPLECGELRRQATTEGEAVTVNRRRYLDITSHYEQYTAVAGKIDKRTARLLATSLGGRYHYIKDGSAWVRITLEPASLKVQDDGEGLVKMEFDFRFVENQSENRATGTLSQGLTMSVDDVWDEVAIAAEHVSPNDNIIY